LHKWQGYLDFNDVVLNAVGAGLGVLILRATLPETPPATPRQALCRPGFFAVGGLLAGCLTLAATGLLRVVPAADSAAGSIVLRRHGPPSSAWQHTSFGTIIHELLPLEGAAILAAVLLLYLGLDRRAAVPRATIADVDPAQPE
jgi:hypothetical protein